MLLTRASQKMPADSSATPSNRKELQVHYNMNILFKCSHYIHRGCMHYDVMDIMRSTTESDYVSTGAQIQGSRGDALTCQ